MFASIPSATIVGVEALPVSVEVDVSGGLQQTQLVGLADSAVRESRVRVKSALENGEFAWPAGKVCVNLAPADIRKDGTLFDLPIAMGILAAEDVLDEKARARVGRFLVAGELSLEGEVRSIRGALSLALAVREQGLDGVILPEGNVAEASLVPDIIIVGCRTLHDAIAFARTGTCAGVRAPQSTAARNFEPGRYPFDLQEVRGQQSARRALEIAAAGGHNLLMVGPPGSGKTMLARRLLTVLPRMSFEEALETTRVYSVSGMTRGTEGLVDQRPFRAPHHTISDVGMVGGGAGLPRPGEISLAHNGILFLDELPEFRRNVLEVLRQPLEDGVVSITRSLVTVEYPANIMLVASMNPCPCGYHGDARGRCKCSEHDIARYRARISGPLMDRIDIHLEVPVVAYAELREDSAKSESSSRVQARVEEARERQRARLAADGMHCNAAMGVREIERDCQVDEKGHALLERVVDRLGMSARTWSRILKVARTIADLAGVEAIAASHVAEAISLRALDRRSGPGRRSLRAEVASAASTRR